MGNYLCIKYFTLALYLKKAWAFQKWPIFIRSNVGVRC